MELAASVKKYLNTKKVLLWEPPYHPDTSGSLASLAATIAPLVSASMEAVTADLEQLREKKLLKIREANCVTLLGRVATGPAKGELREEFSVLETGAAVLARLCERIGTGNLKVIAYGRVLQEGRVLKDQGWKCDSERGQKPLKVIFIASFSPPCRTAKPQGSASSPPVASASESTFAVAKENGDSGAQDSSVLPATLKDSPVEARPFPPRISVAAVRQAAVRLTQERKDCFDLYNSATGKPVVTSLEVRRYIVAAMGLHARGRELLAATSGERDAATPGSARNVAVLEALEFLVEADRCFECCRQQGAEELLETLHNFGQLQLDICWAYALLGDSDCLTDATTRLHAAERMIKGQMTEEAKGSNFFALMEVAADQGKTLKPDVLPHVRLWLLRGIARHHCGHPDAKADLQRAALFMGGLRVREDAIAGLLGLGSTRVQAIAALRHEGGDPNRAAERMVTGMHQKVEHQKHRNKQRQFGNTANGTLLNLQYVESLKSFGYDEQAAVKALATANNDVNAALDALQSTPGHTHLLKISDESLAKLVSLGFDESAAECALQGSGGSVEDALVALKNCEKQSSGGSTTGEAGAASSAALSATSPKASAPVRTANAAKGSPAKTAVSAVSAVSVASAVASAASAAAASATTTPQESASELFQCRTGGCARDAFDGQAGQGCCRTCSGSHGKLHGPDCNRKFNLIVLANQASAARLASEAAGLAEGEAEQRRAKAAEALEAERQARANDAAFNLILDVLGNALLRSDLDEEAAGAELEEEEAVVNQHLSLFS